MDPSTEDHCRADSRRHNPSLSARVRAVLELVRAPNVFTAVADVSMGFLFTRPPVPFPQLPAGAFWTLGGLVVTSSSLYLAGMVLNDVMDRDVDARDRPGRPIPSGRVTLAAARRLGYGLLVAGVLFGAIVSGVTGRGTPVAIATLLAGTVLLYDGVLKQTPLGPLAMGSCRFLNVLLGMSVAAAPLAPANLLVAAGIGTYVVGVTVFARTEARTSSRWRLMLGTMLLVGGMAILAALPALRELVPPASRWRLFWLLMALLIGWRCVRALVRPTPRAVQAAVRNALHSLIVLDAAVCFAAQGPDWAVAILVLVLPAMLLGRWLYVT